jgi:omega-6 fatty acid desaturase (delta-12 desaturase)
MVSRPQSATPTTGSAGWRKIAVSFQQPNVKRSLWQVANSFIPYMLLWYAMIRSMEYSYWLTFGLTVLAGGFLVRIFIILHDCGHGSFFPSRKANEIVGSICGLLTFTAFYQWRHDHAMHHATNGDLDRRGHGDVPMLTVAEYLNMTPWQRLQYRVFRHPISLLLGGPFYSFVITQRFVLPSSGRRERLSVYGTNAALLAILIIAWFTIGIKAYLLIQVPVVIFAGMAALWMFYCQHQFEGVYFARHDEWDFEEAAIKGSSYFRLPRLLQWFTGNIGFHHVHHLCPRIPNYNLEACHEAHPRFQEVTTITLRSSLSYFALKFWDEERQELVGLKDIQRYHLQAQQ